ncbi:MAG: amidase [Candidatus Eremiobacteraeota bacterium]|nr:amidase [Candidatus Eremiobacteraeota bacterium]
MMAKASAPKNYRIEEKSIAQLQVDLGRGKVTSETLVRAYLARIAAFDASGPSLHSVIAVNPHALADARAADRQRRAGKPMGSLGGIPILIKDNIESNDPNPTTAGSSALARNVTRRDAPVVRRLKDSGAIVLGKTNLSEWANSRSSHSISGWSAVGGLVKNPYALDRNACGSSSGTGAAIAASFAAAGVGTETDGSVVCPSSINGLVGLKPTVGLVSRTHVVPISHSQDTPGPMARSVADVAIMLTAMAGSDPADPATSKADAHKTDYVRALAGATLRKKRIGVLRFATGGFPEVDALFAAALATLRERGATIVELKDYKPDPHLGDAEGIVLLTEFKVDLNAYLASTPARVKTRTLADLIAFNRSDPRELILFGQDTFEQAQATKGLRDPAYLKARAVSLRAAGADGIDTLIDANKLDALVAPSDGPAWRTDVVAGDHFNGGADSLPAIAGYPHLTVPMGYVRGLPVGLSLIGKAWTEAKLLALGAAYESATKHRRTPTYAPSVESGPAVQRAFAPKRRAAT